jgi:hypothetical protein
MFGFIELRKSINPILGGPGREEQNIGLSRANVVAILLGIISLLFSLFLSFSLTLILIKINIKRKLV